jgi:hypothetical protein
MDRYFAVDAASEGPDRRTFGVENIEYGHAVNLYLPRSFTIETLCHLHPLVEVELNTRRVLTVGDRMDRKADHFTGEFNTLSFCWDMLAIQKMVQSIHFLDRHFLQTSSHGNERAPCDNRAAENFE